MTRQTLTASWPIYQAQAMPYLFDMSEEVLNGFVLEKRNAAMREKLFFVALGEVNQ